MNYIFNKPEILQELSEISLLLVRHEQSVVAPMYNRTFFNNGKTVGEVLNDTCFLEKLVANGLEIAGAKILDKYISVDGYDFTLLEDRMSYFSRVFDEYFTVLAQPNGFDKLLAQRASIISSLGSECIAYGEHFQEQNIPQAQSDPLSLTEDTPLMLFEGQNEVNIFPTLFSGEHEIVKINVDPLAYFLATNPDYEVIAHNITELWHSANYHRTPLHGGTAFWNPNLSYLNNSTYLALYTDGEYHYHQPFGEVRGITFPFLYNKITGIPLTVPITDTMGHYNHGSTIDILYNAPETFNTPSHLHWYNPYWNQAVYQARIEAVNHYLKAITVDRFMDAAIAPVVKTFHYDNLNSKLELKIGDIFHDNSKNIDFSAIPSVNSSLGQPLYNMAITSMELANGTLLEVNKQGNFECANCHNDMTAQLENAANSILHHTNLA